MPRVIIKLDKPIKDWEVMSAWERETVINSTILEVMELVMDTVETVTLVPSGNGNPASHKPPVLIILDPDEPHIITKGEQE